jgi:SAM-dependent methyltransferase
VIRRLGRLIPASLRPAARRLLARLRGASAATRQPAPRPAPRAGSTSAPAPEPARTADELRDYWRRPPDGNVPESYRDRPERSAYLVELVGRHAGRDARILEIGCNVGRNLHHLWVAGYHGLTGVEISEDAIVALRGSFPDTAANATLLVGAAEETLPTFADGAFDLTFTMAVLEHIHPDSEAIFDEIRRITSGVLITIEDERSRSWRHFARDYGAIFGARDFTENWSEPVPAATGLPSGFVARVFRASRAAEPA